MFLGPSSSPGRPADSGLASDCEFRTFGSACSGGHQTKELRALVQARESIMLIQLFRIKMRKRRSGVAYAQEPEDVTQLGKSEFSAK